MSDLANYEIVDEYGVTRTLQLDAETAKKLGAKPVATKQAAPTNKARKAATK